MDYKNRRQGILEHTGHARRWDEKLLGFTFGIFLVFILNFLMGCASASELSAYKPAQCNMAEYANDERCVVYMPDEPLELDTFEVINES